MLASYMMNKQKPMWEKSAQAKKSGWYRVQCENLLSQLVKQARQTVLLMMH